MRFNKKENISDENLVYDPELLKKSEELAKENDRGFGIYNGEMLKKSRDIIDTKAITKAMDTLNKYKKGKEVLEARILEEEDYYMLQWNKRARAKLNKDTTGECPSSAWLFNALTNKHADAMDSFPEPICLPREKSDEKAVKTLNSILPVLLEQNKFEKTYSDVWWYKLKHGTGVYSVMWNNELENGLGNVDIQKVDLLNIFWEPGIKDIQKSSNIFTVELINNDVLESMYPELSGKVGKSSFDIRKYNHDDTDTSDKSLVIDWYYKKKYGGKTILHYCKFVGDTVLYASENDPVYSLRGFYDHGLYPFVFDVLYPEESTPVGIGIIAIGRDPQTYIDLLDKYILEHARKSAYPRWLAKEDCGINEDEWNDWERPVVHVQGGGNINDERFKSIDLPKLDNVVINERDSKINELKETSNNRDFSNGSTMSGVTSGAAIATLQEAGNKTSRDMIKASYRSFVEINHIIIELIRQFYTEKRSFRIKAPNGAGVEFIEYDSSGLEPQASMVETNGIKHPITDDFGEVMTRIPIVDVDVRAQKQSPFTTVAQNETAMNLYTAGFFEPERAQMALICLEMMDFEAKDKVYEYISQGQTLFNQVNMLNNQIMQASQAIAAAGVNPVQFGLMPIATQGADISGETPENMGNPIATARNNAADNVNTPYTEKLIEKAMP